MDIRDEVEMEAYFIYEKSGCICGCDFDNWLEAERIVLARYAVKEALNSLSAEEQMTVPKPTAVFAKKRVAEEVVKPAKKAVDRKTVAKPKKETAKKETKKTIQSEAKKKK